MLALVASATLACGGGSGGSTSVAALTGSTARFAVVGEHLYVLNRRTTDDAAPSSHVWSWERTDCIDTFSLADPAVPSKVQRTDLLEDSETLFAAGSNLFVGGSSSMQIVSIATPEAPALVSTTSHFPAKDPVVVSGDTAYVTLRSQSGLQQNELQIYDLTNLASPTRIGSFAMTAPWGLSVRHDRAYVCDGSAGLRVLSVATPSAVQQVAQVDTNICFDALTTDTHLVTTGAAGVVQYQIDPASDAPVQLSTIPLQSP
jgi:hypothetical protein